MHFINFSNCLMFTTEFVKIVTNRYIGILSIVLFIQNTNLNIYLCLVQKLTEDLSSVIQIPNIKLVYIQCGLQPQASARLLRVDSLLLSTVTFKIDRAIKLPPRPLLHVPLVTPYSDSPYIIKNIHLYT